MGGTTLTINGGGFTYDGTISKIYIDQDGQAPYDVTLELANNQFKVNSDSKITQVIVETDVQEGNYKIGLYHTDRGVYFSNKIIKITQSGTIKIESEYVPQKYFAIENYSLLNIEVVRVLLILIALLFLLISVYVVYTNLVLLKENKLTNKEVNVIFTGEPMPLVNKEKKRKSGRTVKGKFVAFTFLLITIVVIAVAFQVAKNFIQIQEKTIADGLQNQMQVLLKSISSGTKNFFPTSNILELSALPSQKSAMDEVKYVTIVGQPEQSNSSENLKFVWASNDEEIDSKIDNYSFEYGVSQITDEKVFDILKKFENLDKEINVLVGETSKRIEELTKEATQLSLSTAEEDQLKMQNLSEISRDLRNNLDSKLEQVAEKYSGSYPYFDTDKLDRNQMDYIFYHPVLYRQGASENYLHCVVIAELSTKELIQNLDNEIKVIIILCGMIALIAVRKNQGIGLIAACVIAGNLLGFVIGTYGAKALAVFISHDALIHAITSFITTEILGFGLLMLFNSVNAHKSENDMPANRWLPNMSQVITVIAVLMLLRILYSRLFSNMLTEEAVNLSFRLLFGSTYM